jgi:hypothetical protein
MEKERRGRERGREGGREGKREGGREGEREGEGGREGKRGGESEGGRASLGAEALNGGHVVGVERQGGAPAARHRRVQPVRPRQLREQPCRIQKVIIYLMQYNVHFHVIQYARPRMPRMHGRVCTAALKQPHRAAAQEGRGDPAPPAGGHRRVQARSGPPQQGRHGRQSTHETKAARARSSESSESRARLSEHGEGRKSEKSGPAGPQKRGRAVPVSPNTSPRSATHAAPAAGGPAAPPPGSSSGGASGSPAPAADARTAAVAGSLPGAKACHVTRCSAHHGAGAAGPAAAQRGAGCA